MIADKAFINYLRQRHHMNIPEELEDFLLEEYGEEPFPYEYTEQDLYEQIRKMAMNYHKGLLSVALKEPELRLKQRYETLKDEYINAMYKVRSLEDEVENLKKSLQKQEVNNYEF
jgi:hypothetical protein